MEEVAFSDDRVTVRLQFIGGREWTAEEPACSVDYSGRAQVVDDTLEVAAVVEVDRTRGIVDGQTACESMGHVRFVVVELPGPFEGTHVQTVDGGRHPLISEAAGDMWVIPPAILPPGWERRLTVQLLDRSPPFPISSVYAPIEFPQADDPQLRVVQYFEPVAGQGPQGGGAVTTLQVAGERAFMTTDSDGTLVLNWNAPSGHPITIFTHERAFSGEGLVAVADAMEQPEVMDR